MTLGQHHGVKMPAEAVVLLKDLTGAGLGDENLLSSSLRLLDKFSSMKL